MQLQLNAKKLNKQLIKDTVVKYVLQASAILSASLIFWVISVILLRGIAPFITDNDGLGRVEIIKFLTGDTWLIGTTFASSLYSIGFVIVSTVFIAILSLLLSFPIGVLTALFIAKIAPRKIASVLRTVVEMLAAVPSIVYGLFGSGIILRMVYNTGTAFGIQTKGGNSTIAVVLVLALMTIPTITALSEVAIRSVDKTIIEGSLALGASETQTHFKVVLASAKSGIFTSAILGIGRSLGEATAVSLVAGGRRSGFSFDLFDTTSTLTTTMLEGMKETMGIDYQIRFSVGLVLLAIILITNLLLNAAKKKVGNVDVK